MNLEGGVKMRKEKERTKNCIFGTHLLHNNTIENRNRGKFLLQTYIYIDFSSNNFLQMNNQYAFIFSISFLLLLHFRSHNITASNKHQQLNNNKKKSVCFQLNEHKIIKNIAEQSILHSNIHVL